MIVGAFRDEARIRARRAVPNGITTADLVSARTVRADASCANAREGVARVVGTALERVLATARHGRVRAIGVGTAHAHALIKRAGIAVVALLIARTTGRHDSAMAVILDARVLGAGIFGMAVGISPAAVLDLLVVAVAAMRAFGNETRVVRRAIVVVETASVDRYVAALVCALVTVVARASILVVTVVAVRAAVLNRRVLADVVHALVDRAFAAVVTVCITLAAIRNGRVLAHVRVGVTIGAHAHVIHVAVRVVDAAILNGHVHARIVLAQILRARIVVVALGDIGIAAARDRREHALVDGHVAVRRETHILGHAVFLAVAAVLDGHMRTSSVAVAHVGRADVVVAALIVGQATLGERRVDARVRSRVARRDHADVDLGTVLSRQAAVVARNGQALVLNAQIFQAHIGSRALRRVRAAARDVCEDTFVALARGLFADVTALALIRVDAAVLDLARLAHSVALLELEKLGVVVWEHAPVDHARIPLAAHLIVEAAAWDLRMDALVVAPASVLGAAVVVVTVVVAQAAIGEIHSFALVAGDVARLDRALVEILAHAVVGAAVRDLDVEAVTRFRFAQIGRAHIVVVTV